MKSMDRKCARITRLVDALFTRELDPAEQQELQQLICEDAELRRHYLRLIHQDAVLPRLLAIGSDAQQPPGESAILEPPPPKAQTPARRPAGPVVAGPRLFDSRLVTSVLVAAAVCLLFLITMAQLPLHFGGGQPVARESARQAPVIVARLTQSVNCQWSDGGVAKGLGAHLRQGQRLELLAGLAEITFRNGAQVILEGPARFHLLSDGGGQLYVGKLLAKVPPRTSGVEILSPAVRVVDLGTEFGLLVASSGDTQVQVISGVVAVEPNWGKSLVKRIASGNAILVQAAVEIGSRHEVREIAFDQTRFAKMKTIWEQDAARRQHSQDVAYGASVPRGAISIDGRFDDWKKIAALPDDPAGDAMTDNKRSVDLIRGAIAHDQEHIYITTEQAAPTGFAISEPWIFIDADMNLATGTRFGWIGKSGQDAALSIGAEFHLSGVSTFSAWEADGVRPTRRIQFNTQEGLRAAVSLDGRQIEMSVPRALLGDPDAFRVIWIAPNRFQSVQGKIGIPDYYPDTAAADPAAGSFHYRLSDPAPPLP